MAIFWKPVLDIVLVISVIATALFLVFVKQKEVYLYINLALLSVLCFLYWVYISEIRKRDLMRWLERNKPSERPSVKFYKRKLKHLISAELPYWSWIYLHIAVIGLIYAYIPTIIATAWFYQDSISPKVSAVLCVVEALYFLVIKKYIADFKMRFRVKYHSGSLLLLIGTFLLFNNIGTLALLMGDIITVVGIAFHYDVYKQYFCGVNLRIDTIQEVQPVCNGDATGVPQFHITFFERRRRELWNYVVNNV